MSTESGLATDQANVLNLIKRTRSGAADKHAGPLVQTPISVEMLEKMDILPRRLNNDSDCPPSPPCSSDPTSLPLDLEHPTAHSTNGNSGESVNEGSSAEESAPPPDPANARFMARMAMISRGGSGFSRSVQDFSMTREDEAERSESSGELSLGVSATSNLHGKHVSRSRSYYVDQDEDPDKTAKVIWKAAAWYVMHEQQKENEARRSPRARRRPSTSPTRAPNAARDRSSRDISPISQSPIVRSDRSRLQSSFKRPSIRSSTDDGDSRVSQASSIESPFKQSLDDEALEALTGEKRTLDTDQEEESIIERSPSQEARASGALPEGLLASILGCLVLLFLPFLSVILPNSGIVFCVSTLVASFLHLVVIIGAELKNLVNLDSVANLSRSHVVSAVAGVIFIFEAGFVAELATSEAFQYNLSPANLLLRVLEVARISAVLIMLGDKFVVLLERVLPWARTRESTAEEEEWEAPSDSEGEDLDEKLVASCRSAVNNNIYAVAAGICAIEVAGQAYAFFHYRNLAIWTEQMALLVLGRSDFNSLSAEASQILCIPFSTRFSPGVSISTQNVSLCGETLSGKTGQSVIPVHGLNQSAVTIKMDMNWHESFIVSLQFALITIVLALTYSTVSAIAFRTRRAIIAPIKKMIQTVIDICHDPLRQGNERPSPACSQTGEVEKTVRQLAGMLRHGFGEAGKNIICNSMQQGKIDLTSSGLVVQAFYGFCDIRNFTDLTEILQPDVVKVVNEVAEHVHKSVADNYGAPNKNIGDAFLLVWKPNWDLSIQEVADSTLRSYLRIIMEVKHSRRLQRWAQKPNVQYRLPGFKLEMGYGLHHGWSIECAIGSERKVDISYLSQHVNLAARLEAATKQYRTPLLMSEDVVSLMSRSLRRLCRIVDRVTVKGSGTPLAIFTYDVPRDKLDEEELRKVSDSSIDVSEFFEVVQPAVAAIDRAMVANAIGHYTGHGGELLDWARAQGMLETFLERYPEDGPASSVLAYIKKHQGADGQAPPWWQGFRPLDTK